MHPRPQAAADGIPTGMDECVMGYILTVNDTFTSSDMEHYNKYSEEKGLSEIRIQQADRLATHLIEIKVSPQHIW